MDFKTYKATSSKKTTQNTVDKEDVRKTAEQYAGKSEDELLSDIVKMANANKASGELSDEKLIDFEKRVAPMLNNEQRARLHNVIKMLKN